MNVTVISGTVGTLEHVSRIIAKSELKVGSVYNRENGISEICVSVEVNNRTACTGTETVILAKYCGNVNMNGGLSNINYMPKTFQLTKNAARAWKEYVKVAEEILIQFINEQ